MPLVSRVVYHLLLAVVLLNSLGLVVLSARAIAQLKSGEPA